MFPQCSWCARSAEFHESHAKPWFHSAAGPLCRLHLQAAGRAQAPQETSAHIIKELLAQRWLSLHNEYTCYECRILSWLCFPGRTPCSASSNNPLINSTKKPLLSSWVFYNASLLSAGDIGSFEPGRGSYRLKLLWLPDMDISLASM